jgi:tetratricopeptide (TPR) repeat protein
MTGQSQLLESELARRYDLDHSVEWQRLLTHFEWRQAFAFIVMLVPDKYGAEICWHSLEQFLTRSDKKLLTFHYGQPEELKTLTEQLMGLEPSADTGAIWVEAVVPEAVKEYQSWRDAWRVAAAVLNRFRNPLTRRFKVPLLFVGAPWLQVLLREIAPDLWSVATLVVRVEPEVTIEGEPEPFAPSFSDMIDESAPDPEFASQTAERLRGQAGQELQLASLLHRAGKGYLARLKAKQAEKALSEAVELRKRVAPETDELADTIYDLSWSLAWQHRFVEAIKNLEESLRIYRQTGSVQGEARCIGRLGTLALWSSDYAIAKERHEQALPLFRKIGYVKGEADCIKRLGDVALRNLDHLTAKMRYEQALALYRKINFPLGEAQIIRRLGDIAFERSDLSTARERYEQALFLYRKIGDVWGEAKCIRSLGDVALRRSDQVEARRNFEMALRLFEQTEEPLWIGLTNLRLARLAENELVRTQYTQTARKIWERTNRPDLIRKLEEEFGDAKTNS